MIRNRRFHSTGSKRSAPRQCRVFRGNTGAPGEDDFPENRLQHDLALPVGGGLPLPVEWNLRFLICFSIFQFMMRWLPQLMCILPSLSRSLTSRLSMTDMVTSNSSKISDCSFTSPVLMNSFSRSFVSTSAIRFCSTESL